MTLALRASATTGACTSGTHWVEGARTTRCRIINPDIVTNSNYIDIVDINIDNNDNDSCIIVNPSNDNNIYIDNNDDSIDININVTDNSDPSHRYVTPPTWW